MTADISVPRFAPVTNMVLTCRPVQDPQSEQWRSQYVSIPSTPAIDFDVADDFTVEVWVSLPEVQECHERRDNAIVEKWAYPTGDPTTPPYPYVIRCYNGSAESPHVPGVIYAARYDGTHNPVIKSKQPINDGQFHHVAFVKQESQLTLYVDAESQGTTADTVATSTKNDFPLCLGRRSGGDSICLTGSVGQLRIWGRSMSAAEVAVRFIQGPLAGTGDGALPATQQLVGDWRCDEGYGTTAHDYALGNHGRLGGDEGDAASPTWTVSTIRLASLFNLAPHLSAAQPVLRSAEPPASTQEAPQEEAVQEQAVQEQAVQEQAVQEQAVQEQAVQEAEAAPSKATPSRSRSRKPRKDGSQQ